jgi:hypothetical protein
MPRTPALASLALAMLIAPLLMACDEARPTPTTPGTSTRTPPNSAAQPLLTVPEGELYRGAPIVFSSVAWSVDGSCVADDATMRVVQEAVEASASDLAAVDYGSLSLPRFVTLTQKLKVEPIHWQKDITLIQIEACGSEGGSVRWQIYSVLGPKFEQPPTRAPIHRSAHVYALYSLDERAVKQLVASIRGYVLE